jgi:glycosyltransferase involved in cell wall biosynthesis/2-polyprenyl-3-methyl-5-hydroxy-6-metoxy-1,4-benzoquinol methylase
VEQKEAQIKLETNQRNQFRMALSEKEADVRNYLRRIEFLEVTQSGLLWGFLVSFRRMKDWCLPPETRRRAIYDRGLRALKVMINRARLSGGVFLVARHPVKTLKNLNRVNVNKFFYHVQHSDPAVLEAKLERKLGLDQPVSLPVTTRLQKFALIISGCPGDAFRYRCEHQAEQLRFLGLTVDITYFDQVEYRDVLDNYQCYWLHRVPHAQVVEEFIRSAQEMGKPVIFDTDDLIFDEEKIPYIRALQWMSQDEVDLYYDGVRRYHRTLSLCRFATVTTEPLREAIQRLFPQIQCFVNPNALSDAQVAQADEALSLSRRPEDENIVRIAYLSGTRTHNIDFQECSGALKRILEAHPHVRLMAVGHLDLEFEFDRFGERIERYPLLPWQQLPGLLRKVDINLAPLELDNPFTESKSALKYFEAAVMGVPTVASDVRAYRDSIRHGENGFLCRTEDGWFNCLAQMVEDADMRRRIGQQARTGALKALTTRRQALNLKRVLNDICQMSVLSFGKTLSIAFVLRAPIAQVGGGYKVIFHLAHYLARRGHDVQLYVEPIAHLEGKTEVEIIEFCRSYFGESQAQIHVGHDSIQPSDVAIATNWPTAFIVDALVNTRCKAYLIQDYEPEFYDAKDPLREEVEKTYNLPLRKLCIGRYLARLFTDRDRLPAAVFDFPLDHEIFHAVGRKTSRPIRLLFFARPALKRRGYSIGLEALESVHRECPEVQIYLYGMEENPRLSFPYTNLGVLDQRQLAQAMRDSDVHLSFSLSNISQVPFQAMACGCAVVEAKLPSVEAMVEDGKHCLLAEPQPDAVVAALRRLIEDGELRSRIAKAGMEFVRDKTWDNSCKQFEDIVLDALPFTKNGGGGTSAVTNNGLFAVASASKHKPDPSVSAGEAADLGVYYRSCNFCGGKEFRVFKRLDTPFPNQIYGDQELNYPDVGKHLTLQYLECIACGLIGINPLTRFSDINRNSFDGERNIVAWADLDFRWYEADKLNEIRLVYEQYELESYRLTNRILDVSCGPGVSLSWLRDEKGWNVFGIDPDRHSVRTARDRYGIRIENGLIHDIEAPDEYFDIIIMDNSLEHTFDPNSTLLRVFRLLRKGGCIFIAVPNSHGLSTQYLNVNAHWGHWFLYSPRVLHDFLSSIGFVVARIYAVQESVNQAIIDQGCDIQPYKDGLRISLSGEVEVSARIEKSGCFSDYFHLLATKPFQSGVSAECETTLLSIAQSSLQQLANVTINEGPATFQSGQGKE